MPVAPNFAVDQTAGSHSLARGCSPRRSAHSPLKSVAEEGARVDGTQVIAATARDGEERQIEQDA
jgi:hypothetical protein